VTFAAEGKALSEDYERQKMELAVDALATSAAPIQRRLEHAWTAFHTLIGHGFTKPEHAAEFARINELLTADQSDETAGHVATTCRKLSDDDASKIASAIFELNARLHQEHIWDLEDQIKAAVQQR
jgi:hypothetical protein